MGVRSRQHFAPPKAVRGHNSRAPSVIAVKRTALLAAGVAALAMVGVLAWAMQGSSMSLWEEFAASEPPQEFAGGVRGARVYWADGESGTLEGRVFRLRGVDAPEISPFRSRCEAERTMSLAARSAADKLTKDKKAVVTQVYGRDRFGRELVDLSVDGEDVATHLIAQKSVRAWRDDADEAHHDWCA